MPVKGPYRPGQHAAPCGCYYPDIVRLQDHPGIRIVFCWNCGFYWMPWTQGHYCDEVPTVQDLYRARFQELCRLVG